MSYWFILTVLGASWPPSLHRRKGFQSRGVVSNRWVTGVYICKYCIRCISNIQFCLTFSIQIIYYYYFIYYFVTPDWDNQNLRHSQPQDQGHNTREPPAWSSPPQSRLWSGRSWRQCGALSLVQTFTVFKYFQPLKGLFIGAPSDATPAVLCFKEPARCIQSP